MVLGLCRLLLRDGAEAEDAAQQAFLSAYRALLGGAVPREPAAWLATIARNECRARVRNRMRAPLTRELPDDLPDPLADAIGAMDLGAIRAALAALPLRQREAFLLRELGGLSYDELAVALGVTVPAVESLLLRARSRLRVALAPLREAVPSLGRLLPWPFAAKLAATTVGAGLVVGGFAVSREDGGPARADPKPSVPAVVDRPAHEAAPAPARTPLATTTPPPIRVAAAAPVAVRTRLSVHAEPRERGDSSGKAAAETPVPDNADSSSPPAATSDAASQDGGGEDGQPTAATVQLTALDGQSTDSGGD